MVQYCLIKFIIMEIFLWFVLFGVFALQAVETGWDYFLKKEPDVASLRNLIYFLYFLVTCIMVIAAGEFRAVIKVALTNSIMVVAACGLGVVTGHVIGWAVLLIRRFISLF